MSIASFSAVTFPRVMPSGVRPVAEEPALHGLGRVHQPVKHHRALAVAVVGRQGAADTVVGRALAAWEFWPSVGRRMR